MTAAPGELAGVVTRALGREYRLTPLSVKCTYPVFRGETAAGERVFVKLATRSEWERTAAVLKDVGECRFFARLLVSEPIEFAGSVVMISEWRESRIAFPEDFDDAQVASFVSGCREFSDCLRRVRGFTPLSESSVDPERLYDTLSRYAARHRFAARLLKDLLSVPESERTYAGRELTVVHGDFHAKNLGFEGDRFTCVYDFDKLTEGLACGDMVNALVERYSLMRMSAADRVRLAAVASGVFRSSPWPADELRIAVNVLRLAFAVRRIEKHPDSGWVALDILRRDWRIRGILETLV